MLSNDKEAQPLARLSSGPALHVALSPAACPQPDRDKRLSSVKIVSKMDETRVSLDSPCPRAAPMPPIAVSACPSQEPPIFPFGKLAL